MRAVKSPPLTSLRTWSTPQARMSRPRPARSWACSSGNDGWVTRAGRRPPRAETRVRSPEWRSGAPCWGLPGVPALKPSARMARTMSRPPARCPTRRCSGWSGWLEGLRGRPDEDLREILDMRSFRPWRGGRGDATGEGRWRHGGRRSALRGCVRVQSGSGGRPAAPCPGVKIRTASGCTSLAAAGRQIGAIVDRFVDDNDLRAALTRVDLGDRTIARVAAGRVDRRRARRTSECTSGSARWRSLT